MEAEKIELNHPNYDSGIVACLTVVANDMGIAVAEATLARECVSSEGITEITVIKRIVKKVCLTAKLVKMDSKKLLTVKLPAMAVSKSGTYMVIQQINAGKALIFDPRRGQSVVMELERFVTDWDSQVVIVFQRSFSMKDLSRQFNLTWFIPVIIKYKRYFFEILGAAFFFQLFGLVVPLCTQVIIDKVIVNQGSTTLSVIGVGMICVAIFRTGMNMIRTYLFTHTTNKIDVILGTRMFNHLLYLPIRFFETRRVGDTLMRIAALNNIREFLTGTAMTVLIDLAFSVVFFAVMFYYSTPLTLIAVIAIPIQLIINIVGTPIYQQRLKDSWDANAENNAFVVEAVTGIQTIKSLAVEPQFNFRWERLLTRSVTTNLDKAQLSILLQNASNFTQKLFTYLIIWYGGLMVMDGKVTLGQFIAFQMLSNQAGAPLLRLIGMWQSFQQTRLATTRIGDILNAVPEPATLSDGTELPEIKGEIKLEDVNFRYNIDGNQVLQQVNLTISPGMKVGIVGRSGSGKSTLSKIVQRLYCPESGHIYIDGIDISRTDPAWLRRQMGVVLQENYLFKGSIRSNIAFACQGVSMEKIIWAAKLAGAHEFITELPEGYDAAVGERGTSLSGGQCQRIAIARALLSDPKIIIFDEATSALDYESENIIMENIEKIAVGRTMLIIAHRLANVVNCDVIIVMDNGKIAEQGTHKELMSQQGIYYNLYNQQGDYHA